MIGRNNFRGDQKLWQSRQFYCGTIVLMLLLLAGCAGDEPPMVAVLEPLAQKCAANHPILSMIVPFGWSSASREVTVLGDPEVGSPILGHFPIVGGAWQPGPQIPIWPVKLNLEITFRKTDTKWSRPRTPGSQADALVHGRESQEPNVPTLIEEVKKEKTRVLCYAFKNKEGQWELTGLKPTDDTPFYQKWWQQLSGGKGS
jgi:hypothetical protein